MARFDSHVERPTRGGDQEKITPTSFQGIDIGTVIDCCWLDSVLSTVSGQQKAFDSFDLTSNQYIGRLSIRCFYRDFFSFLQEIRIVESRAADDSHAQLIKISR